MLDWLHAHEALLTWLRGNEALLGWLAAASIATFVGSLIAVPWLVVRIPADYFAYGQRRPLPWADRHPLVRALLVLPGQGILTIVIGILLLDFPGKRELERRVVARPAILRSINWLRQR